MKRSQKLQNLKGAPYWPISGEFENDLYDRKRGEWLGPECAICGRRGERDKKVYWIDPGPQFVHKKCYLKARECTRGNCHEVAVEGLLCREHFVGAYLPHEPEPVLSSAMGELEVWAEQDQYDWGSDSFRKNLTRKMRDLGVKKINWIDYKGPRGD